VLPRSVYKYKATTASEAAKWCHYRNADADQSDT